MKSKPNTKRGAKRTPAKTTEIAFTKKQAVDQLWRLGRIAEIKLHSSQLEVYEAFKASREKRYTLNCSRRWGKSTFLCAVSAEQALQHPGSQIHYAAPTAKSARRYIVPLMRELFEDCPDEIRPQFRSLDSVYSFPNGSQIYISGCDKGHAENLRGTNTHLGLVDEGGSIEDLAYVISDILMPQTLTTGGRILVASTPPITPAHPFAQFAEACEAAGAYSHKTLYDNPLLTPEVIEQCIRESGGKETTTFRREYLAEFVVDAELAVVPEFTPDVEDVIVGEVERPKYFDAYVSMDIGFVNATAVLFGYWDFKAGYLVIEDELILNRMTTEDLAIGIRDKEVRHWGPDHKAYMRISDVDHIVINDLMRLHNICFSPTPKDNKEAMINALRLCVAERKLRIHPRCRTLISQLRHAVWNKQRTKFEKSEDSGHFDTVDALAYLIRNLVRNRNPYPDIYEDIRDNPNWQIHRQHRRRSIGNRAAWAKMFPLSKI